MQVDGARLEVVNLYAEKGIPTIVFVGGLGAPAERNYLLDKLAKRGYEVTIFGPRNAGESSGILEASNFVEDSARVIDSVTQRNGRKPYVIGHSMGGYATARILGKEAAAEKAVLLAPLMRMDEQNTVLINRLAHLAQRGRIPKKLSSLTLEFLMGGKQKFGRDGIVPFINSVYESPPVDMKLLAPTRVYLAESGNWLNKISNLRELEEEWKKLGADVRIVPGSDHWFSSWKHTPFSNAFGNIDKYGMTEEIVDLLR